MPVDDHAVHPKTRFDNPVSGCNNHRPILDGYKLLTRKYAPDGSYYMEAEWIPHNMSRKCRQVDYDTLPECRGCPQEKDMEYITRMKERLSQDVSARTK